jgi:MoaA/NifB/PqqE/SkfB family radical SAM enzyme
MHGSSHLQDGKNSGANGNEYDPALNEVFLNAISDDDCLPSVIWHITDRCPLTCPYCFATKTQVEVDSRTAHEVVVALKALKTQKVDLAGGEPLVCAALPDIFDHLSASGIHMTITTSGCASRRSRRWLVERASKFSRVVFSLDAEAKLHDELRGQSGIFTNAIRAATEVVNSGGIVRINTVVTRRIIERSDALKSLATTVASLNVQEWMLIQPHPANKKPEFDQYATTTAQFEDFVNAARDELRSICTLGNTLPSLLTRAVDRYSRYWVLYPNQMLRRHTSGSADTPGVKFTLDNLPRIRSTVLAYNHDGI